MSTATEAKKYLGIAGTALTAIEQIRGIISNGHGQDHGALIGVIFAITEAITAALSGSTSVEHAEEQIHVLVRTVAASDAAARDELDARFPPQG